MIIMPHAEHGALIYALYVKARKETVVAPAGDDDLLITMLVPDAPAVIMSAPDAGVATTPICFPVSRGFIVIGTLTVLLPPGIVDWPHESPDSWYHLS